MITETLISIFNRDLNRLKIEIESYRNEKNLWISDKAVSNSGGNLCLHLIGNLNSFIGAELGKTGYIRNRPLEFSEKDIPKTELISKIESTIAVVKTALEKLSDDDLKKEYPLLVLAEKTSTEYFLIHLSTHLTYHLGQINYHRRLLDN